MENIKIIDNFLDKNELYIINNMINNRKWEYGHVSGGDNESILNVFFANYHQNEFFLKYIPQKLKSLIPNFKIIRNYMHIQLIGQDGSYHIDEEGINNFTFCLYINNNSNENIENIGGDFFIKIPEKKYIISIETLNNRGILFPSMYLHKGIAYNNYVKDIKRLCITWKLEQV